MCKCVCFCCKQVTDGCEIVHDIFVELLKWIFGMKFQPRFLENHELSTQKTGLHDI